MSPLLSDERRALLELARRAIVDAVVHSRLAGLPLLTGALAQPAGAFVSLHFHGQLRGCIGQIEPTDSLAETVRRVAIQAALEDPRFPPVRAEEIPLLEIEVSVLSRLEAIRPEQTEVGKHGLLVTRGRMRGLLLPQVATQCRWAPQRFLEETCLKAGLDREAWKDPATKIEAFTAEVFSETELHAERHAQAS